MPAGDDESKTFTTVDHTETTRLATTRELLVVGEHDDTVMALRLANIAGRIVEDLVLSQP